MAERGSKTLANWPAAKLIEVVCEQCDRHGRYRKATLVERYGKDIAMPDLLREIEGACPRVRGRGNEGCGARYVNVGSGRWD